MIVEAAGQRPKIGLVAPALPRLAAPVTPLIREGKELAYQYEAPFVVESGAFERAFGIQPTPYREGIRQTLAWLERAPRLAVAH